jgi:UDP-3-O-[3-hydroxymyristoyl] glucosamine N-acyltransferase
VAHTVGSIAAAIGGTVEGDPGTPILGVAGLREAETGELSFLANPKYSHAVAVTRASAVIVGPGFQDTRNCALIRVENPDKGFTQAVMLLAPAPVVPAAGIHPTAVVAPDAKIGAGASVGPCCVIEPGVVIGARCAIGAGCYIGHGCRIGDDCRFHAHVSLREHVKVGNRCIIHNGAVVGSDGFGYYKQGDAWVKIPQVGVVEIGDDVEIGANTTIDRARFGRTVIGNGVKLDNLVQIAHNARVGENTAMAAQTGISGSTVIGKRVQMGGQSGAAGHITIGDDAVVLGKSGVTKDIPAGAKVIGFPAAQHEKAARLHAHVARLPELKARVAELESRILELEKRLTAK